MKYTFACKLHTAGGITVVITYIRRVIKHEKAKTKTFYRSLGKKHYQFLGHFLQAKASIGTKKYMK